MDLGDDLLVVLGVGFLLLYLNKKVPSTLGLPGSAADVAANAATGTLTAAQIAQIAQQTAAGVSKAGGTPAQQAASAQEVTNYAQWMKPLGGVFGIGGIPATTQVPGTGLTIYEMRAQGISDDDIWTFFQNPVQNAISDAASSAWNWVTGS